MALGCGAGGSTVLYGAALERLTRSDFSPGRQVSDKGQSELPDHWPISYDDLSPYYQEMERLFNVCGTPDPLDADDSNHLAPPPPLGPRDQHLFDSFEALKLNPYRQHVAIDFIPGCQQCMGRICTRNCKRDARNTLFEPALRAGASAILECDVMRFESDAGKVTSVVIKKDGVEKVISAKQYILAAGALFSPALLLKSANNFWPNGLANNNDQVGRCLMFHGNNLIAIWPLRNHDSSGPKKSLCFKNFYFVDGCKYGTVQAMGIEAGRSAIYDFLDTKRQELGVPKLPLLWIPLKIIARIAEKIFGPAKVFAGILEDFPYTENQVMIDYDAPSGIHIRYQLSDELKKRTQRFRHMITNAVKPHRTMLIDRSIGLNYGHATGTCRFGSDPETSVLDKDNRAWGLNNLIVVDASFFPSSGGINPSLTIGANALRVADKLVSRLKNPTI